MATYNEDLLDAMLRHQIGLLRFSSSVRNEIWALIDATEEDLRRQILAATNIGLDSPKRVRALKKLLESLRKTRVMGWKEARKVWFEEMNALAVEEAGFFDRIFQTAFPGVELGTVLPSPLRLRNIVATEPFMGKTLAGWADGIERVDIERIEGQIMIGLTQGESPQQISRRIVGTVSNKGRDGVTQITRNNAAAITRTVTNGIANESRQQYIDANSDLLPFKLFTATLDSRTTPICRRFDGKRFKHDEGPVLPLHMGERSLYSPIGDGDAVGRRPRRDFTERSLLREYAKKNGIKPIPKSRAALPRGHKGSYDSFARGRMRELTGGTPAKTTYGQWLKRQSAAIQDDILGPTRGALFRRGGLKIEKFVDRQGATLTLAQLAKRNADAFQAAGLDPADFTP